MIPFIVVFPISWPPCPSESSPEAAIDIEESHLPLRKAVRWNTENACV
jgi:hypothetical protein